MTCAECTCPCPGSDHECTDCHPGCDCTPRGTGDDDGQIHDWDDHVVDLAALVTAARLDHFEGSMVLIRYGDRDGLLATAVRVLARMADAAGASPAEVRSELTRLVAQ